MKKKKAISCHQKKHLAVAQRQSDLTEFILQTRRRLSSYLLITEKYSATDEMSSSKAD